MTENKDQSNKKKTENQKKWEERAEKLEKAGKGMQSLGCLLTLFVTIPILLFLLFL